MDQLHWPLTVLNRSIPYKNLTAASQHIGISQPQLSRLIKQLEENLDVTLLDRSSPRHTTWTPQARKLAEIFGKSEKALSFAIDEFKEESQQKEVSIGTLEGLSPLAKQFAHHLLEHTFVETIQLNVFDQNDIESRFLVGDLDLVFTSRSPNNKKFNYIHEIGYQFIEPKRDEDCPTKIYSTFEYNSLNSTQRKRKAKRLISNSLYIRKSYQQKYGGTILLPSTIHKGQVPEKALPVAVIAQDFISQEIWNELVSLDLEN